MPQEIKYVIPAGAQPSTCRGCKARIFWVKTASNKNIPVDFDGTPHWAACPKRELFKRAGQRAAYLEKEQKKMADRLIEVIYRLDDKERDFINNVQSMLGRDRKLNRKQHNWLMDIFHRHG